MKKTEEIVKRNIVNPSKVSMDLATEIWEASRYTGTADSLDKRSAAFLIDKSISQAITERDEEIIKKLDKMIIHKPTKNHEYCEEGQMGEGCGCHYDSFNMAIREAQELLSHLKETK